MTSEHLTRVSVLSKNVDLIHHDFLLAVKPMVRVVCKSHEQSHEKRRLGLSAKIQIFQECRHWDEAHLKLLREEEAPHKTVIPCLHPISKHDQKKQSSMVCP